MNRYSFQNLINFTYSECYEKGLEFIGQNHKEPAIVGVPGVCKLFIVKVVQTDYKSRFIAK